MSLHYLVKHTHTHQFNGPGTYVCKSASCCRQITTPPLSFFTSWMHFVKALKAIFYLVKHRNAKIAPIKCCISWSSTRSCLIFFEYCWLTSNIFTTVWLRKSRIVIIWVQHWAAGATVYKKQLNCAACTMHWCDVSCWKKKSQLQPVWQQLAFTELLTYPNDNEGWFTDSQVINWMCFCVWL